MREQILVTKISAPNHHADDEIETDEGNTRGSERFRGLNQTGEPYERWLQKTVSATTHTKTTASPMNVRIAAFLSSGTVG